MSWERDPRSGALLHKPDRRSEHVVPAWTIAGIADMLRFGFSAEELRPYGLLPPIAGAADAHANFAYSTVLTAPSPATTGTSVVLQSGDGANFPAVPFNAVVCPAGVRPTVANAEIVRATARPGSADTFTITRIQESTSARTIVVGDQFFNGPTKKSWNDVETASNTSARAIRNATLSIANTTFTAVTWNTTDFNNGTLWAAGNPTRLTAPATGIYLIESSVEWVGTATIGNVRFLGIRVNGAANPGKGVMAVPPAANLNFTNLTVSVVLSLSANDYVEAYVYQDSGAALNIQNSNVTSHCTMVQLG